MNFIKTTVLTLGICFLSIYPEYAFSGASDAETSYEMFRRIQASRPAEDQLMAARKRFEDTARTDKDIFLLSVHGGDNDPKYLFATLVLADLPVGTSYKSFYEDRTALIQILADVLVSTTGEGMAGFFYSLTSDQHRALEKTLSKPVSSEEIDHDAYKHAKLQGFFEAIIPFRS